MVVAVGDRWVDGIDEVCCVVVVVEGEPMGAFMVLVRWGVGGGV